MGVVGRPPESSLKFHSSEELQEKIDSYFAYCDARTTVQYDKYGKPYVVSCPRPYTLSGLADFLDCSRQTILNYSKKDNYFCTILRARRKCEKFAEEQLFEGNDRGAKFSLANNHEGWKEKQGIELTGADGGPVKHEHELYKLTDEELDASIAELQAKLSQEK